MPSALEFWALEAALDRVEAEALAALHRAPCPRRPRDAAPGSVALGADLWIESEVEASTLVTAVSAPIGEVDRIVASARSFGANASPEFGVVRDRLIRFDHTGRRATDEAVLANLLGYALAVGEALDAGQIGAILTETTART